MPPPTVSTNGKTIDASGFSDAFSKSFRIKCKVKFDDMILCEDLSNIVPEGFPILSEIECRDVQCHWEFPAKT